VDWRRLADVYYNWASESQEDRRGGFDQIVDVLWREKRVVEYWSKNTKDRHPRRLMRAFDFEGRGPKVALPPREKAELPSFSGVSVTLPIEFPTVAPSQHASVAVRVLNSGNEDCTLESVSFLNGIGPIMGPFSLRAIPLKPKRVSRNGGLAEVELRFSPTSVGVYKCIVMFDFRIAASKTAFQLYRYVCGDAGDATLRESLKATAPYTPRKQQRQIGSEEEDENSKPIEKGERPPSSSGKFVVDLVNTVIPPGFKKAGRLGEQSRELALLKAKAFDESGATQPAQRLKAYCRLFSLLLFLEEIQMGVDIRQFDMAGAELVPAGAGLVALTVPGLAEKRPSALRGDALVVSLPTDKARRWEGIVHRVNMLELHLKFSRSFNAAVKQRCDVQFTLKRTAMKLLHQGIKDLDSLACVCPMASEALQPPLYQDYAAARCRNLNSAQERAVRSVLSGQCRPAPFIVYGPPGTGKTTTLVEAIRQVLRWRPPSVKVLVCAPSNKAADVILKRLIDGKVPASEMFRLMSYSRERADVPSDALPYCRFSGDNFQVPSLAELKDYRVVVSTLAMASKLHNFGISRDHFGCIFIDECGHCMEADVLSVLGVLLDVGSSNHQQVVLAGDPQQLGPIVRSSEACKFGLDVSFLERLIKSTALYRRDLVRFPGSQGFNPYRIVKLVDCYRCHSEILKVPNEALYDGDLQPKADPVLVNSLLSWVGLPNKKFPVLFHGAEGENDREADSPSWFNISEAEIVVNYVKALRTEMSTSLRSLKLSEIGIITPYQKQVSKIRQALRLCGCGEVDVGSVEQFQGDERRIIIISTVRSNPEYLPLDQKFNLGFVANPKRFNVSVTRAQALLIVVGSPKVLSTDPNWSRLLWHCVDNCSYVGVQPLPARPPGPDAAGRGGAAGGGRAGDAYDSDEVSDAEAEEADGEEGGWAEPVPENLEREVAALAESVQRMAVLEAKGGAWEGDEEIVLHVRRINHQPPRLLSSSA